MTVSTAAIERPTDVVITPASRASKPTEGQRLALALGSFVLLIPLTALTAALVVPLTDSLPGWSGAIITTCAQALVCVAVVGVTLALGAGKGRTHSV